MIFIGDEDEGQVVLGLELGMALGSIWADPDDDGVAFLNGFMIVTEAAGLLRSARGIVFAVEIHHHALAAQAGEFHRLPVLIRQGEVGSRAANFEGHGFS
jgi:hypothetical protein